MQDSQLTNPQSPIPNPFSMSPTVLILRAPGTNCDQESAYAFEKAGARANRCTSIGSWKTRGCWSGSRFSVFPAGSATATTWPPGRILANQMEHHLAEPLARFKEADKLILGICNGFQVMIKSGILLPPDPRLGPPATLTNNDSGKYEDRWVRLRVDGQKCVFFARHRVALPAGRPRRGEVRRPRRRGAGGAGPRRAVAASLRPGRARRRAAGVSRQSQRFDGRRGGRVRP